MSELAHTVLVIHLLVGATISITSLWAAWQELPSHAPRHLLLIFLALTLFWPLILWPGRRK